MEEYNALRDFWLSTGRLYENIEEDYGIRLSAAEKMLLRGEIDWNQQGDLLMPRIVSDRTLARFGFDSTRFSDWRKLVKKGDLEAVSEYELRAKAKKKNKS